jgi:Zn-dependent protease with chaperone function
MANASRRAEYQADRHAAMLGEDYRLALRRALDDLSQWERPRNGWEAVLAASHPPIEYRMERLEAQHLPAAKSSS